ncbi:MAG: hypothetical protein IKJ26_08275 [Clostridia bacterium]|nr:hypothetical protein [Clostridia bacterium]
MAGLFGESVKTAFLKGIEAIGKGASTLAEGAQNKLNEINLETRRREILNEIPKCVQELYEQGIELPEKLTGLLGELSELDAKLAQMRPQPAPQEEAPAEEEQAEATAECECDECCACEEQPEEVQEAPAEDAQPEENN